MESRKETPLFPDVIIKITSDIEKSEIITSVYRACQRLNLPLRVSVEWYNEASKGDYSHFIKITQRYFSTSMQSNV